MWPGAETHDTGLKWQRKMSQRLTDKVLKVFSCQTPSPHNHFRLLFRACMTPTVYAGNVNTQYRKTTGKPKSNIFYNDVTAKRIAILKSKLTTVRH